MPCKGEKGDGGKIWLVFFLPLCVCHWSGGEQECARAADGVALLSGVRLALPLLYHSLCTVPMLRITSQLREKEIWRMDGGREGVSQEKRCRG